jgi:hypothetical protein
MFVLTGAAMNELAKTLSLALDRWYKLFIGIGLLLGAAALTMERVQVLGNVQALRLSAALLCFGLCAWKGDKIATEFIPPNIYTGGAAKLSYPVWKWDLIAVGFLVVGLFFLGWFIKAGIAS